MTSISLSVFPLSFYPQGRQVHPITGDYSSLLYCAYQLRLNPSKEISFPFVFYVKLPFKTSAF